MPSEAMGEIPLTLREKWTLICPKERFGPGHKAMFRGRTDGKEKN
jgi:hypothetical protein